MDKRIRYSYKSEKTQERQYLEDLRERRKLMRLTFKKPDPYRY